MIKAAPSGERGEILSKLSTGFFRFIINYLNSCTICLFCIFKEALMDIIAGVANKEYVINLWVSVFLTHAIYPNNIY
jgi:hypothetical protein